MSEVYISCPLSIPTRVLVGVAEKLRKVGKFSVRYWNRGTYDPSLLNNADIFVFMTSNNNWSFNKLILASGVFKELNSAISQNKPIYMVYQNSQGEYNFYLTNLSESPIDTFVTGIQGSSADIFNIGRVFVSKNVIEEKPKKNIEQPILKKDTTFRINRRGLLICK